MDDGTTVSIIIPVKPGGRVTALERLRLLDYPPEQVELTITEGCWPSRQRNEAAGGAAGKLLLFLDDDALLTPGHLNRVVAHFTGPRIAVVGGPSLTPPGDSPFQRTLGIALASWLGGGGARNRYRATGGPRETGERELILCNLAYRRDVFLSLGGLDERLYPNEENELLDRTGRQGWRLIHDPALAVCRSQRPTYRAFARQFFGYGRGRGEQTRIAGVRGVADFIPSLFLLYLCCAALLRHPLGALPLACYGAVVVGFSLVEALRAGLPSAGFRLLAIYPILHFSYGAGLIRGLMAPRFLRDHGKAPVVTLRRVKPLGAPWPETF